MISVNDRDTRGVDIGVENEHEITASRTVPRFANECHWSCRSSEFRNHIGVRAPSPLLVNLVIPTMVAASQSVARPSSPCYEYTTACSIRLAMGPI